MKPDVAIVGAGYVGMPLARAFAEGGKNVVADRTAKAKALLRHLIAELKVNSRAAIHPLNAS